MGDEPYRPYNQRMKKWIWAIIVGGTVLLTGIAFGRTLTQDSAPLDDDLLITHNLAVRGMTPENLKTVFTSYDPELYIPLTFVSYQIDYVIGGLDPWIYHLTNIVMHMINAGLIMLAMYLLMRMYAKPGEGDSPGRFANRLYGIQTMAPIIFAGWIFAVHPLNTEAVAWLAGRKDLLSTMFFLTAWIGYMRYRDGGDSRIARTAMYWISIMFFVCALLSKIMAVTLPVILIMIDVLIERRKWEWKIMIDKIPYLILSGIFFVVALAGKERILAQHSIYETALMAAKSTVFYLEKFLIPVRLGTFYPYHGEISIFLPEFFVPVMVIVIIAVIVVFGASMWRKEGMAVPCPYGAIFGIIFFIVTLAPTFTNFHKGGEMYFASDRYVYLPMMGLLFVIAIGIDAIMKNKVSRHVWMGIAGTGVIITLTIMSFIQTKIWDSPRTLFANTLTLYPQSVAARSALATMDKNEGRYDQAIKLLRDGLGYGENAQLRMNLGTVFAKVGRVEDAADQFNQTAKLDPLNPEPFVGLGVLDEYNKKIPEAMANYRKAVDMDPSYVEARNKLGSMLLEEGKMTEAEEQFRAALTWNPNAEGVLYNMSLILDAQEKRDEALADLEKANALSPDEPKIMTAIAKHLSTKDPARVRGLIDQVLRMNPRNSDAQTLLKELQ